MKRASLVCLALALLAGALVAPAHAAKEKRKKITRQVVAPYDNPTFGLASGTGGAACLPCPKFAITAKDKWVKMVVADDVSPAPAAFGIRQMRLDGTCCDEVAGPFCGSTGKRSVRISPGLDLLVYVYAFGDIACPGALGTTGIVRATFSNAP